MDLRPGNEGEDLSHLRSGWDVLPLCPAVCQICLLDVAFFTCLQTLVIFAEISVLTGLALLGVVLALKVHKARPLFMGVPGCRPAVSADNGLQTQLNLYCACHARRVMLW